MRKQPIWDQLQVVNCIEPLDQKFFAGLGPVVKPLLQQMMSQVLVVQVLDINWLQSVVRQVCLWLVELVCACWVERVESVCKQMALRCPKCGSPRKCKSRPNAKMNVKLLGCEIEVPKLYFECGHADCDALGVSITKVLTGLRDGSASAELELSAAYTASQHSYAEASRELEVHHGQTIERTTVRRMALHVEAEAKVFLEQQRKDATSALECREHGVERLMVQADGGSVRTGELVNCEPGDRGFGKTTPKTKRPCRKRRTRNRELITIDVREPGSADPAALDVVVPCMSPDGTNQRPERLLAAGARAGLGDNTLVLGLGDLGSSLPDSFDIAFVDYDSTYSGDWKHVRDYVDGAWAVLDSALQGGEWDKKMRDAIWNRDATGRDNLLDQAYCHVDKTRWDKAERCPLWALDSYLTNNWSRMNAKQFKDMGVDFVSARAECQVRVRTKDRYSVAGAWHADNIEGKAVVRALVAEGSWGTFRQWYLERTATSFEVQLRNRLALAQTEGRIRPMSCIPAPPCEQLEPLDFESLAQEAAAA